MHVGNLVFRHVTSDAILFGDRAGQTGAVRHGFCLRGIQMAGQAAHVVGTSVADQRLMRIVTGQAGKPSVALTPAAAALQAIGMKANVSHTRRGDTFCVPPGRVTGAAEVH